MSRLAAAHPKRCYCTLPLTTSLIQHFPLHCVDLFQSFLWTACPFYSRLVGINTVKLEVGHIKPTTVNRYIKRRRSCVFSYLRTNLVPALPGLQVHYLTHVVATVWWVSQRIWGS